MAEHHSITSQVDHSRPHQPDDTCGKCKRKFGAYDRVSMAYIIERSGVDPNNVSRRGLYLYQEFEFVHIDCTDPRLIKGAN